MTHYFPTMMKQLYKKYVCTTNLIELILNHASSQINESHYKILEIGNTTHTCSKFLNI
jgi:hypothetical protein